MWHGCAELYEQAIQYEKGSFITSSGALATLSGAKTGRSPKDKRVVRDDTTEDELWWGKYVILYIIFRVKFGWLSVISKFGWPILNVTMHILILIHIAGVHPILRWMSKPSWSTEKELLIISILWTRYIFFLTFSW